MSRKFLILLAFPLLVFACANEAKETTNTAKTETEQHESHNHSDEAIVLDNGKAWKVDDNMMSFIQNMDSDVANFSGTTYNDYQVLAMSLTENKESLTSNCTMTGQAHDELHKWLLPYIDILNDFAKANNEKDAAIHFAKVKESFKEFHKYFE